MKEHINILKDELASGQARIFDVREPDEWEAGHLEQSTLVPLSQLKDNSFDYSTITDKEKKTYLYCRSGRRVQTARTILEKAGFTPVIDLREGFTELQSLGFPTLTGK